MSERIEAVCDLLLGAAYVDQTLHENEKSVIRKYLAGLASGTAMEIFDKRIENFTWEDFDFDVVVANFIDDSADDKHKLIKILAAVHTADDEHDVAEDDYLRKVANSLAVDALDLQELVLDYQVETLKDHLEKLRRPPPVPKDARVDAMEVIALGDDRVE